MTHLIRYDVSGKRKSYVRKVCFIMYIKKSVLSALTAFVGAVVLLLLAVLFCFTEIGIPAWVYAAGWFGSLWSVLYIVSRIYR